MSVDCFKARLLKHPTLTRQSEEAINASRGLELESTSQHGRLP